MAQTQNIMVQAVSEGYTTYTSVLAMQGTPFLQCRGCRSCNTWYAILAILGILFLQELNSIYALHYLKLYFCNNK